MDINNRIETLKEFKRIIEWHDERIEAINENSWLSLEERLAMTDAHTIARDAAIKAAEKI